MIERGWMSSRPLRKSIAIKCAIDDLATSSAYKELLMLALIAQIIQGASNVKFGPEIYCGDRRRDAGVYSGFEARVLEMAGDLDAFATLDATGTVRVFEGDSRECYELLKPLTKRRFSAGICSPPYPTEHDYTRNSRLELAFLGSVFDRASLRSIKSNMIRSHTKNIYSEDNDRALVTRIASIKSIVQTLQQKTRRVEHGFGKLYPTVVSEYFGGMRRHFQSIVRLLKPKAMCAYVVGDQSSYLRVHIPTAQILGSLAEKSGFKVVEITHWRTRWSTSTSREVDENILILQKKE